MSTFTTSPITGKLGQHVLIRALAALLEDPEADVDPIFDDLESGRARGLLLRAREGKDACGVAVWHNPVLNRAFIEVSLLYVDPDAPAGATEALIDALWETLLANANVEMIATRVREGQETVRAALRERGAVTFRRNLMIFKLLTGKLRRVPRPQGYSIVNWRQQHDDQVRALAPLVMRGSIDEIVVAEAQADRVGAALLSVRHNNHPDYDNCVEEATLVALDETGAVVGYILTTTGPLFAILVDVGVHPAHRQRGLGRALVGTVMQNLDRMACPVLALVVTAQNVPAVRLYQGLGFEIVSQGESAVWWRDGRQHAWQAG